MKPKRIKIADGYRRCIWLIQIEDVEKKEIHAGGDVFIVGGFRPRRPGLDWTVSERWGAGNRCRCSRTATSTGGWPTPARKPLLGRRRNWIGVGLARGSPRRRRCTSTITRRVCPRHWPWFAAIRPAWAGRRSRRGVVAATIAFRCPPARPAVAPARVPGTSRRPGLGQRLEYQRHVANAERVAKSELQLLADEDRLEPAQVVPFQVTLLAREGQVHAIGCAATTAPRAVELRADRRPDSAPRTAARPAGAGRMAGLAAHARPRAGVAGLSGGGRNVGIAGASAAARGRRSLPGVVATPVGPDRTVGVPGNAHAQT